MQNGRKEPSFIQWQATITKKNLTSSSFSPNSHKTRLGKEYQVKRVTPIKYLQTLLAHRKDLTQYEIFCKISFLVTIKILGRIFIKLTI